MWCFVLVHTTNIIGLIWKRGELNLFVLDELILTPVIGFATEKGANVSYILLVWVRNVIKKLGTNQ